MVAPNPEYRVLVYRIYSPLGLLYVGQTKDLAVRLASHQTKAWWPVEPRVYVEGPFRRAAALEREAELIRTEEPLYNGHPYARVLRPL